MLRINLAWSNLNIDRLQSIVEDVAFSRLVVWLSIQCTRFIRQVMNQIKINVVKSFLFLSCISN